jgi:hypothetical protein
MFTRPVGHSLKSLPLCFMKMLLTLLGWLGLRLAAFAQSTPPAPAYDPDVCYSVAQMQADLAYVCGALQEAHPALYWYTPKDSLDRAFTWAAAVLTHPLAEPEYWKILQTLAARVAGALRSHAGAAFGRVQSLVSAAAAPICLA